MKTQSRSRNQNLRHPNLAAPRLWRFPLPLPQQNRIPGRHHQLPVHQHHVIIPQEHPHLQILDLMVVLLKTFRGYLRRGLDANQDETAESMRSSNFLLPTAGPLIKMWRRVLSMSFCILLRSLVKFWEASKHSLLSKATHLTLKGRPLHLRKVNKTLTNLGLTYNAIGDESATSIAEVIKVNKTLTNLNLYGNCMRSWCYVYCRDN